MPSASRSHSLSYRSLIQKMVAKDPDLFDFMLDEAKDGLWILKSDDYNLQWASPSFWAQLGYSPDSDLPGRQSLLPDTSYREELRWLGTARPPSSATRTYRSSTGAFLNFTITTRKAVDEMGESYLLIGHQRREEPAPHHESLLNNTSFLLAHINDLICIHQPDGVFKEISPAINKVLNYEPEDLIGTNVYNILHPDDIERVKKESHEVVMSQKAITRIQYRIRKKNGSYTWFDTITEPFFDEKGQLNGLMTTSRDVSDLRQLNERITQLSTLLDATLRYTDEFIVFKDQHHRVIAASDSVAKINGFNSKEELIGKSNGEYIADPDLVNMVTELEKQVIASGKMQRFFSTLTKEDGSTAYLENKKYPIYDARGDILGIYGIATDITHLRSAELQLAELSQQLKNAQQVARIGSYHLDLTDNRLYPSENFIRLFGLPQKDRYSLDDLHGLIHPDDREETIRMFYDSISEGNYYIHEHRLVNPQTKEEFLVLSQRMLNLDGEGNPVSVDGVKLDITKQKEAEEIRQRIKTVQIQNKEMEQFTYVASHDLQEPLRTIRSFVDILLEDYQGKLGEKTDYHLNTISNSAKRMSRLIRELLHYSRLGYERQLAIYDLNHIVDDVLTDLQVKISEQNAQVESDQLPTLQVYETEIRQLFQNLISNAVKFHKPGIPPKIAIRCWKEADHWTFSVEDNGIGMEAEHLDRIFIIFQRLNSSRKYPGTGIGLAYCKKIVELHYGRIWVTSTPGAGSTFYFSIPDDLEKQKL